jgi:hypothetical protein
MNITKQNSYSEFKTAFNVAMVVRSNNLKKEEERKEGRKERKKEGKESEREGRGGGGEWRERSKTS